MNKSDEITFLKDDEWSAIDGEVCRMLKFTPIVETVDGRVEVSNLNTPYASVVIECPLVNGKINGFITHKIDFAMLLAAFNKPSQIPGVRLEISLNPDQEMPDHEVWIIWTKKRYKLMAGFIKAILPRLNVMVCPKGAYEIATNPSYRPELTGEARFLAQRPLIIWTPEVMKD